MQVQGNSHNLVGMQSINNMNANRTKMNSTMMVKFHSSTEKNINVPGARTNLNKSTLLPSNMANSNRADQMQMPQNVHLSGNAVPGNVRTSNSTNNNGQGLKLNPNIVGNNGVGLVESNMFDKNLQMQQNSLDHLNRSLNMHQIQAAFSNNNSFQQSPPNLRNNKGILGHHGPGVLSNQQTTVNSTTNNKFNNLFDKNKTSTLNIKVS